MSRKYESMSDREINIAIERLEGVYTEDVTGRYMETRDYCKNWADMGPLMIEAGISIQLVDVTLELEGSAYKWAEGHDMEITESNFYDNDKALRAAAITYLMLLESAKC